MPPIFRDEDQYMTKSTEVVTEFRTEKDFTLCTIAVKPRIGRNQDLCDI